MPQREELVTLARILADWVAPAPSFNIYLFGSRVRGDHQPTSDVDVVVDFGDSPTTDDCVWWGRVNEDLFQSINALLPGPLAILEPNEPLLREVMDAPVVYQDRQVRCVWMKPKPR